MVIVDKGRRVFELLLAATPRYKALENDLFEVLVGSIARKGQLADDSNSLTVFLDLCDELADVLVL